MTGEGIVLTAAEAKTALVWYWSRSLMSQDSESADDLALAARLEASL